MIGFKQIEFFDHTGISKALLLRGAYGGTEPTARCSAGHLGSQSGQVIRFRFGWRGAARVFTEQLSTQRCSSFILNSDAELYLVCKCLR